MFFERFSMLAIKKDGSPNKTAKILKIPSGSVTAWSKGTIPRAKTISKLADHFGVTADYLLGLDDNPLAQNEQPISTEILQLQKAIKDVTDQEALQILHHVQYVISLRTAEQ